MSARQKAARAYRLENGLFAGGVLPYGFRAIDNPDGKGKIVAQDPDEIPVVRLVVERTLEGYTLYSTMQHLRETGVPTRSDTFQDRGIKTKLGRQWAYPTLDALVRNPMIAGMTTKPDGEVVRDAVGLPVIDEDLAIISLGQWYELQQILATPSAQKRPLASKRKTSALLSGLVFCGDPRHDEPVRMYRKTTARGSAGYTCPGCRQQISSFGHLVVGAFFDKVRHAARYALPEFVEQTDTRETAVREAAARVKTLTDHYVASVGDEAARALAQLQQAKADQEAALALPVGRQLVEAVDWPESPEEEFAAAEDDLQRQKVLRTFLDRLVVHRGRPGVKTDESKLERIEWVWRPEVVFVDHSPMTDEEIDALAAWTEVP